MSVFQAQQPGYFDMGPALYRVCRRGERAAGRHLGELCGDGLQLGSVTGFISFGFLADAYGRKPVPGAHLGRRRLDHSDRGAAAPRLGQPLLPVRPYPRAAA
jgi:hypothetical protein